jgi:hypothetical protein
VLRFANKTAAIALGPMLRIPRPSPLVRLIDRRSFSLGNRPAGGRTEIHDLIDGIRRRELEPRLLMGRLSASALAGTQGKGRARAAGMTPSVAAKMLRRANRCAGNAAAADQQERCNRRSHFQEIGTGSLGTALYGSPLTTRRDTDLGATMTDWFKNNRPIVGWWLALIAVSVIVFAASRSTEFAQLGIGLLSASLALLAAMAIFEVIWQLAAKSPGPSDGGGSGKSQPRRR